jgi:excisionase family DNA binding protein
MSLNLVQIPKEELESLIRKTVSEELLKHVLKGNESEKKNLTIREAAEYLNLSYHTLYTYTRKGGIPFHKPGKNIIFKRVELDKWISER